MPTSDFTATVDGAGAFSGGSYPPASFTNNDGLDVYTSRQFNGTTYFIDNGFLTFNTSSLPDTATVTSATLEVFVTEIVNNHALSIVGEYYAWDGSTAAGDITADEVGGAFSPVTYADVGVGQHIFTLTNVSNISKTGNTSFRLKTTKRASDAAPTALQYMVIASIEHATQPEAILHVTYTEASSGAASFQLLGIS